MSSIVEYSHSVQQSSCNKIAVISNDVANKKIGKMLTLGEKRVAHLLGARIKRVKGVFKTEDTHNG